MASISNDPNGRRRILFLNGRGERKTIRLGKVQRRFAEAVKVKVEDLVNTSITGHAPTDETSRWLTNLEEDIYQKLSRVGLVKCRDTSTLGAFIDGYIEQRSDVKKSTQDVYGRVRKHLVDYFSEDRQLRDITSGDADVWRLNLLKKGLAENTVRRTCGVAKQWFTSAVRSRLIIENPFADLPAAMKGNSKRFYYIRGQEAEAVLAACPDAEWRLLFALARYGGLRVPSEALQLRWGDIHWDQGRFTVTSSKTEHHEGHETRQVPIFPELLPHLREAFEQAEPGADFCITRYRDKKVNLRTRLQWIIKRAGLKAWPKLWQNLRSTRETELADQFPAHVAAAWIGNSVAVAVKHYLQVTEDHFKQAAQNAAQKSSEMSGNDRKEETQSKTKSDASSGICRDLQEDSALFMSSNENVNGRYRTRTCDLTGVIRAL